MNGGWRVDVKFVFAAFNVPDFLAVFRANAVEAVVAGREIDAIVRHSRRTFRVARRRHAPEWLTRRGIEREQLAIRIAVQTFADEHRAPCNGRRAIHGLHFAIVVELPNDFARGGIGANDATRHGETALFHRAEIDPALAANRDAGKHFGGFVEAVELHIDEFRPNGTIEVCRFTEFGCGDGICCRRWPRRIEHCTAKHQ